MVRNNSTAATLLKPTAAPASWRRKVVCRCRLVALPWSEGASDGLHKATPRGRTRVATANKIAAFTLFCGSASGHCKRGTASHDASQHNDRNLSKRNQRSDDALSPSFESVQITMPAQLERAWASASDQ